MKLFLVLFRRRPERTTSVDPKSFKSTRRQRSRRGTSNESIIDANFRRNDSFGDRIARRRKQRRSGWIEGRKFWSTKLYFSFRVQESIFRHLKCCEVTSERFFQVFYEKILLAQKILKNVLSMSNVTNEDPDDEELFHHSSTANAPSISGELNPSNPENGERSLKKNIFFSSFEENFSSSEIEDFSLNSTVQHEKLPSEIRIMKAILRFLQLLCENHNPEFQVRCEKQNSRENLIWLSFRFKNYLRLQNNNKTNYNLVCETLKFLDAICGSQTGLLGLLGNYINEQNVDLINQALNTLTEYCQGPCRDNQDAIVNHESNGIDIIIAIVLNDISPLNQNNYDLVLELKVRRISMFFSSVGNKNVPFLVCFRTTLRNFYSPLWKVGTTVPTLNEFYETSRRHLSWSVDRKCRRKCSLEFRFFCSSTSLVKYFLEAKKR